VTAWSKISGPGPRPPWRVILLDRDGVVIRDRGYIGDPAGVALLPGAAAAMARAHAAGWFLVGVSNQSGLARGLFSQTDLQAVMSRLDNLLAAEHVTFDGFYFCPHGPDDGCSCRKPDVGLVAEAGLLPGLDSRSWVIGDKVSDVELGINLGICSILVRTGYGARNEAEVVRRWKNEDTVLVADDLAAAVDIILKQAPSAGGGRP